MKILFPRYENGTPHWTKETFEREVNPDDYFKTIDDFKEYIRKCYTNNNVMILTIEECNNLKCKIEKAIDTQKCIKFTVGQLHNFKKGLDKILLDYPLGEIRDYWKSQADLLLKEFSIIVRKNDEFIKDNKDAVFNYLDEKRILAIQFKKEKKKQYNKTYAEKEKQKLQIIPRKLLTEEEKQQRRKETNKKYYEKKKQQSQIVNEESEKILTEEETS